MQPGPVSQIIEEPDEVGACRLAEAIVGAALAGAALAVLLDRAWAARKTHPATA